LVEFQLDRSDTTEDHHSNFHAGALFVNVFHDAAKGRERTCDYTSLVTLE
jgi:hypothetical protein